MRRLLAQRRLAVLLCAATLLLRLLVPTGYMIGGEHGRPTIELCSGVAGHSMTMPGMQGGVADHGKSGDGGKAEVPCAFSGLAAAALGAVDPVRLVALLAFVMVTGLAPALLPAPSPRAYLRPPLRGPPARP